MTQRAALVGGDVGGLVAFDLVLRIVLRRPVGMSLVIEVAGMDLYDGPRHGPGFRIPAHMVAHCERPGHGMLPVDGKNAPAPASFRPSPSITSREGPAASRAFLPVGGAWHSSGHAAS